MPMYSCICTKCNFRGAYFQTIENRHLVPDCGQCGSTTFKAVDAPRVVADYEPYNCPITGQEIRGRRAHQENLAKHGCRVYESGEFEDHKKFREKQEEAFLDRMADSAAETALAMPEEKFNSLAGELVNGAEVPLIRTTL